MQQASGEIRDPRDPDPVPSTKAVAAFALAVIGLVLSPFIGGVIPAVVALRLAGQAETEIVASRGFLTGGARVRRSRFTARLALLVAAAVVALGLLLWLINEIGSVPVGNDHDYPPNVD